MEPALGVLRLLQYLGAAALLGIPLLLVRLQPFGSPATGEAAWPRGLLGGISAALAVSSLLGLFVQTAMMAGSLNAALDPASLQAVALDLGLGRAAIVRALCGAVALVLVLSCPRPAWKALIGCGLVACASLAWMGHGAATEGSGLMVHLVSDILHACAAGAWMGALAGFVWMIRPGASDQSLIPLHQALNGFSGIGTAAVATLVVTGLVNSWFLITPAGLESLSHTSYGRLLIAKLGLFALMLVLAATNRFLFTPRLGQALDDGAPHAPIGWLRRSLWLEATTGLAVLALVAWLGMLTPISAG